VPTFLGGGVGDAGSVALPLQTVVVMPWETIYRFDTSPQYLSWGRGMGDAGGAMQLVQDEDVHTRAKDGNEAALKLSVRYRIKPDPQVLIKLVQEVATDVDGVQKLVVAVVRSEIRTFMNHLRTAEFRDDRKRNGKVDETLQAAQARLQPLGIELEAINLRQYRFVRLLRDGREDTSYQDRLREIQELEQDIEGERSRIETVKERKNKEKLEAESAFNTRLLEAQGYKEQSIFAGDAYYEAKSNEAKAIRAEGLAEVEGLRQQIAALSGKGGEALVRLEVVKQLARANPSFVALNGGPGSQGAGMDLSKIDLNQLLQQFGIVEGLAVGRQVTETKGRSSIQEAKPDTDKTVSVKGEK
jgi:regulator of protease activity HflC (stomatin/prohibitin superfamily)